MTGARGPGDAPLVGRGAELAALSAGARAAGTGAGAAVLVVGEAGIGKSRLVAEAVAAVEDDLAVVRATAWEAGAAPAHWHWSQILRRLPSTAGAAGEAAEQVLLRLVPASPAPDSARPFAAEGEQARLRLYEAVAESLAAAAERRPLLLVLEDLHAADSGTLSLLRFLVRQPGLGRIAVLATARDPRGEPMADDVAAALADLEQVLRTLPLSGLDPAGVALLLGWVLGAPPSAAGVASAHRRTGGNPLFVVELGRLLAARPDDAEEQGPPSSVRTILGRRLGVLPSEVRTVLDAAALVGAEFAAEVVAAAVSAPAAAVLERLDRARSSGLILGPLEDGISFRFTHELVREVLVELMPLGARAGLHRRIGEILEALRTDEAGVAELAHHFLAGRPAVDDGRAAHYALRAGLAAAAQMAHEDAAAHLRRALTALPAGAEEQRARILLALGDAELRSGDLPRARASFIAAADAARALLQPDLLAQAALGLGSGLDGFEVRLFDHAQITLLEDALEALGPQPSPLRAWVMARLSVALTFTEEASRRLALADAAVAMARALGAGEALAYALGARCDAVSGPEHIAERAAASAEVVDLARRARNRGLEMHGRRHRLIALLEAGDVPGVDAEIDRYAMVAAELGQPLYQWYVPLWRGMRALMEGRIAAAEGLRERAEEIGARAGSRNAALNAEVLAWNTLLFEGREDEAGARLAAQLALADGIYAEPFWVALVVPRTQPEQARAALERLAATGFAELPRDAIWLAAMTYAADTCALVGDPEIAAQLHALILPHASRFAVDAIGAASYGSMSRPLGVLAAMLSRPADAEAHFADAAAAHRAAGAALLSAQTLLDEGRALLRLGERAAGARALDSAVERFEALGLPLRADEARAAGGRWKARGGPARNVLRWEGGMWALEFGGRAVRVADSKGLRDIAALVAAGGAELHVADLIAATDPAGGPESEAVRAGVLQAAPLERADARARREYRARLVDLREELAEAEEHADLGRAEQAREELDRIADALLGAYGLGGRARTDADAGERARKAVTQRIRNALRRLAPAHPELAAHLERSVRTGRFCSYRPEGAIHWHLEPRTSAGAGG